MKKLVCMALSAALLAGSVPAYAADYITKVPHTFTARVGTTEFTKDGKAQPLDVPIYIKDGYAMLPLRAFLTSIDNGTMHWEKETKLAWMMLRGNTVACDIEKNSITVNGEPIEVSGRMDIRADFCATAELEKYSEWLRLYGGRYGYHLGRGGENGNGAASG